MHKIKSLQGNLKDWNVDVFGDLRTKKRNLMKRLEILDKLETTNNLSSQRREERSSAKCELQEVILIEERFTRQKSKFQWAKEGDANTNCSID